MSGNGTSNKGRRLLVRIALSAAYVGFMAVVFYFGKGHTILLDNKDSEDGTLKAYEEVSVSVDGQEAIDFMSGDRDMVKVRAQSHTLRITVNGQATEKKITVPVGMEMALVSIPKLVAGREPFVTPFVPKDQPAPADESNSGNSNEFSAPAPAAPAPGAPAAPAAPPAP